MEIQREGVADNGRSGLSGLWRPDVRYGVGTVVQCGPCGGIRTFAVVISFWIEQSPDVYRLLWIVGIFISERQLVYE